MSTTTKAAFSFRNYEIPHFSYSSPSKKTDNLQIDFDPSGAFIDETKLFILKINFVAYSDDEIGENIVTASLVSYFEFENVEDINHPIPDYFYRNGIAIVFPYLRSFISVLTTQAQVKHLLLPVLNLTSLEASLRENTKMYKTNVEFEDL
jgi:preprotein translocase subunit SecB